MAENSWHQFEDGATLGQKGSESGVILRDEEHPQEARITLERDTRTAPFAITCGIYGCMLHTRFFSQESEEEGGPEGCRSFLDGVAQFVQTYP
jgi:hypothetical protein